jgi:hypothetical protein
MCMPSLQIHFPMENSTFQLEVSFELCYSNINLPTHKLFHRLQWSRFIRSHGLTAGCGRNQRLPVQWPGTQWYPRTSTNNLPKCLPTNTRPYPKSSTNQPTCFICSTGTTSLADIVARCKWCTNRALQACSKTLCSVCQSLLSKTAWVSREGWAKILQVSGAYRAGTRGEAKYSRVQNHKVPSTAIAGSLVFIIQCQYLWIVWVMRPEFKRSTYVANSLHSPVHAFNSYKFFPGDSSIWWLEKFKVGWHSMVIKSMNPNYYCASQCTILP